LTGATLLASQRLVIQGAIFRRPSEIFNPSRFILILLLSFACINTALAESDNSTAIKTGFLYNFFRFIEWPTPLDSYRLCATANSGLESVLMSLKDKLVNNKPIRVLTNTGSRTLQNCDLIYIGQHENTQEILVNLSGLAVVTVSDNPDFIQQGGMIGLLEVDHRLAFELNMNAANAAGVHISAQMLKLAKSVIAGQ